MAERGASLADKTVKIDLGKLDEFYSRIHELQERYDRCDKSGHQKPKEGRNRCEYCFRQLKYEAPKTDAILRAREKLPYMFRPFDAPVMMKRREDEIELQKTLDWTYGLERLAQEEKAKAAAR